MIKKYNKFNEGISQYLKGPTKEEVSSDLRNKFNEDNDPLSYMVELVKNELLYDILNILTELDYDEAYIPYVIKNTYKYNKTELRNDLFENLKIDLEIFDKIKIAVKHDMYIKLSDNKQQIYNEVDEIERILKYKNNL